MQQQNQREGNYQVLLTGIEGETDDRKEVFWKTVSERHHLSLASLREIMNRNPVVLAQELSFDEAKHLAERLKPLGALVSIDKKNDSPTMNLEFQDSNSPLIALEACALRKTQGETWSVTGRVRNISAETLHDVWVLVQLFGSPGEFLTFEEVPLPLNPLPPQSASPFRVIFEGSLPVRDIAITLKSSGGSPLHSVDHRKPLAVENLVHVDLQEICSSAPSTEEREPTTPGEQTSPVNAGSEEPREVEKHSGGKSSSAEESAEEEITHFHKDEAQHESPVESNDACAEVPLSSLGSANLAKADVEMIDIVFPELKPPAECPVGNSQEIPLPPPALEEASQLLKEITEPKEQEAEEKHVEEENPPALKESVPVFPYVEEFRRSVENYHETHPDHFLQWMGTQEREEGVQGTLRCLVTLLVHARFDQMTKPEKALENTRKVIHLVLQPNVSFEEIPSLEGTRYFSGDHWRLLFHRALPRIQNIAKEIEAKKKWNARELEQLVQIIPHMSPETSRRAVRWIERFRIEGIEVDFSRASILIGGALYRVAARLGVVDPQFDHYEGPHSMGDIKIQAFARTTFPEDPLRVEEPMNWVGMGTQDGGVCAPSTPHCEGCLFNAFCPRRHLHFDPSEKGMRTSR